MSKSRYYAWNQQAQKWELAEMAYPRSGLSGSTVFSYLHWPEADPPETPCSPQLNPHNPLTRSQMLIQDLQKEDILPTQWDTRENASIPEDIERLRQAVLNEPTLGPPDYYLWKTPPPTNLDPNDLAVAADLLDDHGFHEIAQWIRQTLEPLKTTQSGGGPQSQ